MMLRLARYLARKEWFRLLLRSIEPISFVQSVNVVAEEEFEAEATLLFYGVAHDHVLSPQEHMETCHEIQELLAAKGIRAQVVQTSYKGVDTKAPPIPSPTV